MNAIQNLRRAYNLIANADTTSIDAFYLAVNEALGFIAESLDELENQEEVCTYANAVFLKIKDQQLQAQNALNLSKRKGMRIMLFVVMF